MKDLIEFFGGFIIIGAIFMVIVSVIYFIIIVLIRLPIMFGG